jgi:hypothetical protein
MGRAYEVRKASIAKTGAAKAKIYTMYAKEIYSAAKKSADPDANPVLKRLIDKAKKEQVEAVLNAMPERDYEALLMSLSASTAKLFSVSCGLSRLTS